MMSIALADVLFKYEDNSNKNFTSKSNTKNNIICADKLNKTFVISLKNKKKIEENYIYHQRECYDRYCAHEH